MTLLAKLEDGLRVSGLLLQLMGIGVVAYTLRGRGKIFRRGSAVGYTLDWIKRIPSFKPRSITLQANGRAKVVASATSSATSWRDPRLGRSVEDQLEAMRENLETLRKQIDDNESKTVNRFTDVYEQLQTEASARAQQHQQTRKTIEELAANTLYLEAAGLGWLVLGVIMATIPGELAAVFALGTAQ